MGGADGGAGPSEPADGGGAKRRSSGLKPGAKKAKTDGEARSPTKELLPLFVGEMREYQARPARATSAISRALRWSPALVLGT